MELRYEWVFFDLDGTLVESVDLLKDIYFKFMTSQGCTGSLSEFAHLNGPTILEIVKILKGKYEFPASVEELFQNYQNLVLEVYLKEAKPKKDSESVLRVLKQKNLKMALITSNLSLVVKKFLYQVGWEHYFNFLISGDEIQKSKPDPEIYLAGLKKSGAFPEKVLVVEDSENGVVSAEASGLKVLWLTDPSSLPNTGLQFEEEKNCFKAQKISSLSEILAWFN